MAFGYRVFQVGIGKFREPSIRYDFDNVALHSNGAAGLIETSLKSLLKRGDADANRATYFTVDSVDVGGWLFRIAASGGQYGRPRRIRDTQTDQDKPGISPDDAVLDDLPMLLVIPDHGQQGVLVAACQGRSHHVYDFNRVIDGQLRARALDMPIVSNLADASAWESFLNEPNLDVTKVEMIQTNVDPTRPTFGKSANVARAKLTLTVANAATKNNVLGRVKTAVLGKKPLKLAGVFGMTLKDDDFDDYRIVYEQNGREKSLSVGTGYPHFIHPLDGASPPTMDELLKASTGDIEHLMTELGITYPTTWAGGASLRTL